MQNNTAVVSKSRKKEGAYEKTFRIPISTGLFEHCPDMLDAIWLFMWYIDKTTEEEDGNGIVLGGMPIVDAKPAAALGVPVKTIRRWRNMLAVGGYAVVCRTPYGYSVTLPKSKKWNWGPSLVTSKDTPPARDLPKREISTPEETSRFGQGDLPNRAERLPVSGRETSRNGKYKEDLTEQNRQNDGQNIEIDHSKASPLKATPKAFGAFRREFRSQTGVWLKSYRSLVKHYESAVNRHGWDLLCQAIKAWVTHEGGRDVTSKNEYASKNFFEVVDDIVDEIENLPAPSSKVCGYQEFRGWENE